MTKTLIYDKMCTIKPDVRDILWAYEKDHNLDKAVTNMGEVLDSVWNYAIMSEHNKIWNAAIEAAAEIANQCGDYNPASYYVEDIRRLKK